MENFDFILKLLLLGDSGTGKSSIILRYTDNYFIQSYLSTSIGVCFKHKTIEIDGSLVKLGIFDTAGQERFRTITSSFYEEANIILVVFDKSYRETFDSLDMWLEEIIKYAPDDAILMLVGNKCDLESEISADEAQEKALRCQLPYIEVSAKTGEQIDNVFLLVARKFVEIQKIKGY